MYLHFYQYALCYIFDKSLDFNYFVRPHIGQRYQAMQKHDCPIQGQSIQNAALLSQFKAEALQAQLQHALHESEENVGGAWINLFHKGKGININ